MIIDETTSRPENKCDDVYVYITDTVKPGKIWIFHFHSFYLLSKVNHLSLNYKSEHNSQQIKIYKTTLYVHVQCTDQWK